MWLRSRGELAAPPFLNITPRNRKELKHEVNRLEKWLASEFRARAKRESGISEKRLSAIHVESCVGGWLKRSRMRSRKWRKLVMPKACHKMVRKPRLKPSVGPLLERFVK